MQAVQITCPPGAEPGATLRVSVPPSGAVVEVQVPEGVTPGVAFQVHVQAAQAPAGPPNSAGSQSGLAQLASDVGLSGARQPGHGQSGIQRAGPESGLMQLAAALGYKKNASAEANLGLEHASATVVQGTVVESLPVAMQTVIVTCPPNVEPGSVIAVESGSAQIQVQIPKNVAPGTSFQVQVPAVSSAPQAWAEPLTPSVAATNPGDASGRSGLADAASRIGWDSSQSWKVNLGMRKPEPDPSASVVHVGAAAASIPVVYASAVVQDEGARVPTKMHSQSC